METGLLTLCTGTRDPDDQWRRHPGNDTPEAWRDLLASMDVALAVAEDYDLHLGIEPELANVVDSASRARRMAGGRFATVGKGVLYYPHYLRQLKAIGFDGPLIAHGLAEAEAPETARFLQRVIAEAGFAAEKGDE